MRDSDTPGQAGSGSDLGWGRRRGAPPPLPASAPLLAWLGMALALTVLVLGVVGGPGPLEDPDPADQRPGFLTDTGEAPLFAGVSLPGSPIGRQPVFVAFDRRVPDRDALEEVLEPLPNGFATVLAVPRSQHGPDGPFTVLADPSGRTAAAAGVSRPRDGGLPIGYALLDSSGRVRYATIDPAWTMHGFEIATVAREVR